MRLNFNVKNSFQCKGIKIRNEVNRTISNTRKYQMNNTLLNSENN